MHSKEYLLIGILSFSAQDLPNRQFLPTSEAYHPVLSDPDALRANCWHSGWLKKKDALFRPRSIRLAWASGSVENYVRIHFSFPKHCSDPHPFVQHQHPWSEGPKIPRHCAFTSLQPDLLKGFSVVSFETKFNCPHVPSRWQGAWADRAISYLLVGSAISSSSDENICVDMNGHVRLTK